MKSFALLMTILTFLFPFALAQAKVPHVFSAGDVIDADDINANFSNLDSRVRSLSNSNNNSNSSSNNSITLTEDYTYRYLGFGYLPDLNDSLSVLALGGQTILLDDIPLPRTGDSRSTLIS